MRKLILIFFVCSLVQDSFGQSDSIRKAKMKEEIALQAKPVYVKATALVMELRQDIELAKKGTVKKSDVVNHYNETVGVVMGQQTSFEDVVKRLKESGDAYPKYLFLKEEARIAYLKSAEAKYNAQNN